MTTLAHVSLGHLTTEALIALGGLVLAAFATWLFFQKSIDRKAVLKRVKAVYRRFDR